ncbi:MAG: glycoside hydrolase family 16 protein [Ferruginibacter sp.]
MNFKTPIFFIVCLMSQAAMGQQLNVFASNPLPPKSIAGYDLVWNDEFNKEGKPDTTNWIYENGFERNEELQWYGTGNANCMNGTLVIEGRKERVKNVNYQPGSDSWRLNREYAEYTSSSIQTKGHHQWTFGRFEIRARIDTNKGSWPAIWTLGVNKEWPSNGEIDIMEFYRVDDVPNLLSNVAWGTGKPYIAKWHTEKRPFAGFTKNDPDWVKKFHIWRMDWDENSINLYLDDKLLNTTLLSQTLNADGSNPFLQPHFLLLNLALGGNGGEPSKANFKYEVDYVRVYQKVGK